MPIKTASSQTTGMIVRAKGEREQKERERRKGETMSDNDGLKSLSINLKTNWNTGMNQVAQNVN